MLAAFLDRINRGGTLEVESLAREFDISPALVRMMIDQLQQMGRLKRYQACSDGCAGCSLQEGCLSAHSEETVKLWQL